MSPAPRTVAKAKTAPSGLPITSPGARGAQRDRQPGEIVWVGRVKIGIYNEPGMRGVGGSEYLVARLAAGLARSHAVELVHHNVSLTKASLEALCGDNLKAVGLRYVNAEPNLFPTHGPFLRGLRQDREWYRSLGEPYDLFINSTHGLPPFCHAPRGVLLVLFPIFNRFERWPWKPAETDEGGWLRTNLRRYCYEREWRRRLETYQTKIAISQFTQLWTKRCWGVDCDVVYPPVDGTLNIVEKKNTIVSVGRFIARGVGKKQLEMMTAFGELERMLPDHAEYCCIGGLGDVPEDAEYMDRVKRLAAAGGGGARVLVNLDRSELMSKYEQAKVFWHATGYGEDNRTKPELAEHFGIVTVEAMAAGCVPVVINRGAQPEIVQHGINGFVWETLDQLKEHTIRLLQDDSLYARMASAARQRAQLFTGKKFIERFDSIVNALK
jgi:glycosyltransferase involved in cell wall biosynthesis